MGTIAAARPALAAVSATQPRALGATGRACGSAAKTACDGELAPSSALELAAITVVAQRLKLLGTATTASQGVVSQTELLLLPAYRPSQLVETVPGFAATVHSGEGKASQHLSRGT